MKISNKENFKRAKWLDEARTIGTIGNQSLVLLGWEYGPEDESNFSDYPLVSIETSPLYAMELHEIMNRQDPIKITDDMTP